MTDVVGLPVAGPSLQERPGQCMASLVAEEGQHAVGPVHLSELFPIFYRARGPL